MPNWAFILKLPFLLAGQTAIIMMHHSTSNIEDNCGIVVDTKAGILISTISLIFQLKLQHSPFCTAITSKYSCVDIGMILHGSAQCIFYTILPSATTGGSNHANPLV